MGVNHSSRGGEGKEFAEPMKEQSRGSSPCLVMGEPVGSFHHKSKIA